MGEDLADRLDDLICSFEGAVGDWSVPDLGTFVTAVFLWATLGGAVIALAALLLRRPDNEGSTGASHPDPPVASSSAEAERELAARSEEIIASRLAELKKESVGSAAATTGVVRNGGGAIPRNNSSSSHRPIVPLPVPAVEVSDTTAKPSPSPSTSPGSSTRIPTSLGSDQDAVGWVNTCLRSLWQSSAARRAVIDRWTDAINEYARAAAQEDGVLVEFERIEEDDPSTHLSMNNVTTLAHPGDNMTVTADLESSLALSLSIRSALTEPAVLRPRLAVGRMRGRVNLAVLSRERIVVAKMDGWPEIRSRLEDPDTGKDLLSDSASSGAATREEGAGVGRRSTVIETAKDIAVSAIRGSQVSINLESFENAGGFPLFPVFKRNRRPSPSKSKRSAAYNQRPRRPLSFTSGPVMGDNPKQLSVRVLKASQLSASSWSEVHALRSQELLAPYVVVEVDEPGQRFVTSGGVVDGANARWDQEFVFLLGTFSSEVLFEVWDHTPKDSEEQKVLGSLNDPALAERFLGLGIVSVDELLITPSQRHVIPLQGRPFQDQADAVNGLLTIQFVLMDNLDEQWPGSVTKTREISRTKSPEGHLITTHSTTFQTHRDLVPSSHDVVAQAAIAELMERRQTGGGSIVGAGAPPGANDKTTMVIHARKTVRAPPSEAVAIPMAADVSRRVSTCVQTSDRGDDTEEGSFDITSVDSVGLTGGGGGVMSATSSPYRHGRHRQRPRAARRDLMSTIRRRFAPARSYSLEQQRAASQQQHLQKSRGGSRASVSSTAGALRSASAGRAKSFSELSGAGSPISRPGRRLHKRTDSFTSSEGDGDTSSLTSTDSSSGQSHVLGSWSGVISSSWQSMGNLLAVPGEDGSSLSDVSGISAASNKTYINEGSSLVLETVENGSTKFYLIPHDVAANGKFRRKGTKLHIVMDHIFAAKHIKAGTPCQVCNQAIPLRLGKQGYSCRDCGLICHKPCHVNVLRHCPQTTLPSMELECYNDSVILVPKSPIRKFPF